jgi:hypothetical protein
MLTGPVLTQQIFEKREGSGSDAGFVPLTNRSESRRPKNMLILRIWIRIRITNIILKSITIYKGFCRRFTLGDLNAAQVPDDVRLGFGVVDAAGELDVSAILDHQLSAARIAHQLSFSRRH